jgi:3-oxoacyl-[acyl-carrier protein] reductase
MSDLNWNFAGKTALVTGGSRGIGRSIVQQLALAGARVIFTYAHDKKAAGSVIRECNKVHQQPQVTAFRCNFNSKAQIAELLEHVRTTFETPIDHVINNAGITLDAPFYAMPEEKWDQVLRVNLNALFYINKELVKSLAVSRGSIVNISSVSGIAGTVGQVHYSAAKAGVIGFTKALARETGSLGIRVNAVAPGYIDTEMIDDIPAVKRNKLCTSISMRRLGKPSEVADAVMFLLSDKASYITGQTLIIDGGLI